MRLIRDRHLTPEEAAADDLVRQKVMKEFSKGNDFG
jgi:hypothetical protein